MAWFHYQELLFPSAGALKAVRYAKMSEIRPIRLNGLFASPQNIMGDSINADNAMGKTAVFKM
jgi:hypothetical protein